MNVVRELRRRPVSGVGIDSAGVAHRVTVTENLLANAIMYFNGAHFTGPGEIIPAMSAARQGDKVPLLRLGADVDPADGFGSDLREFSAGHGLARSCVDGEFPFDKDRRAAATGSAVRARLRTRARLLRTVLQVGLGASRLPRLPAAPVHRQTLGGPADVPGGRPREGSSDARARRRVRPARPRGRLQARDPRDGGLHLRRPEGRRPRPPVPVGLRP